MSFGHGQRANEYNPPGYFSYAPVAPNVPMSQRAPECLKREVVVIDSRDRIHITDDENPPTEVGLQIYPDPSHYKVRLPRMFDNVIALELLAADIPAGEYLINANNRYIDFEETAGGTEYTATLTIGDYTAANLAIEIALQLNAVVGVGSTYACTYDTSLDKFDFTSDGVGGGGIFNLLWGSGAHHTSNTYYVMGFDNEDYIPSALAFSSTNRINIHGEEIIAMRVWADGVSASRIFSPQPGFDRSYMRLYFSPLISVGFRNVFKDDYPVIFEFQPRLPRMTQLEIEFITYDNRRYDFNGLEHDLVFRVWSLRPPYDESFQKTLDLYSFN